MHIYAPEGRNLALGFLQLDTERLERQQVDAYELLHTVIGLTDYWIDHPYTYLWWEYPVALAHYGCVLGEVMAHRGMEDTLTRRFRYIFNQCRRFEDRTELPPFLDELTESHRARLIQESPDIYQERWEVVDPYQPLYWPDSNDNGRRSKRPGPPANLLPRIC